MAISNQTVNDVTVAVTDDMSRWPTTIDGQGVGDSVRKAADTVAGVAGDVTARLPDVAQTTKAAASQANRAVHQGSDQTLKLLGAGSAGFASGLFVGGANRLLVAAALAPLALIGATLLERVDGKPARSR